MLGLRMLIMPFNLAIAVAATIALTYCCYVVLLFVWRALDTGFLPNWNYVSVGPTYQTKSAPQGARGHNGDSCCFGLLPLKDRSCRPPKDKPKTDAEELINKHPIYRSRRAFIYRSRRAFRLRLIRSQTGQAQRRHNLCNANRCPRDATEPGHGRASDKRAQL